MLWGMKNKQQRTMKGKKRHLKCLYHLTPETFQVTAEKEEEKQEKELRQKGERERERQALSQESLGPGER